MNNKIEHQVRHCLSNYEQIELENKLIDLCKEWFFEGFSEGTTHELRLKDEK